jgi:hypothetical protein
MEKVKQKVFVVDRFSPKKFFDEEGFICEFQDSKNDIVETTQGLIRNDKVKNVWFCILTDPDKITRLKKLKSFGKTILEVDAVPLMNKVNNLTFTSDPNKLSPETAQRMVDQKLDEYKKQVNLEKEQMLKDSRRYAELFSKVSKKGGGYIANADPTLINEFEQLKEKLGIEEVPEAV